MDCGFLLPIGGGVKLQRRQQSEGQRTPQKADIGEHRGVDDTRIAPKGVEADDLIYLCLGIESENLLLDLHDDEIGALLQQFPGDARAVAEIDPRVSFRRRRSGAGGALRLGDYRRGLQEEGELLKSGWTRFMGCSW